MVKCRNRLRYGGRKKAAFGESLAAAAIQAAATNASAIMQSNAARESARQQAESIRANAQRQADAMKQQSENDKMLQEQNIEFMRSQNEQNRQLMRDQQMQLQMLAGYQNNVDRDLQARIVVKNGGRITKYPLRGLKQRNLGFTVTDGGYAQYLGNNLYRIYGDTHDQYHKTRSGKYKSGVGIELDDGQKIEVEGGGRTKTGKNKPGEVIEILPDRTEVFSNRDMYGINFADEVAAGKDPQDAANEQAYIRYIRGVNSDGSKMKTPVERNRRRPLAKYGKRVKALSGATYWDNLGGAGLTTFGNVLGAWLTGAGNSSAAKRMSNAYLDAGNTMADAYSNLSKVDMNAIGKNTFSMTGSAMPAIRTSNITLNPELVQVERDAQRRMSAVNNNTISGAAANSRYGRIATDAYDNRSQIYGRANQINESIRNENANRITQAAATNLNANLESNRSYWGLLADLAKYNNDITNEGILGRAGALSDARLQSANALAQARQTNGAVWGNAIATSAQGFANAFSNLGTMREKENAAYASASPASQVSAAIANGDRRRAKRLWNVYSNLNTPGAKDYARQLGTYLGYDVSKYGSIPTTLNDLSFNQILNLRNLLS